MHTATDTNYDNILLESHTFACTRSPMLFIYVHALCQQFCYSKSLSQKVN